MAKENDKGMTELETIKEKMAALRKEAREIAQKKTFIGIYYYIRENLNNLRKNDKLTEIQKKNETRRILEEGIIRTKE